MAKRIVFINQATGYLTIDIINEFAKAFDDVGLITGSIRMQEESLDENVKVSRITKYDRRSTLRKTLSWLLGTMQIIILLGIKYRRYERVYFTIPPTAYLFATSFKSPFSIIIYDLYPDALSIHNYSRDQLLFKWWERRNRVIFRKAKIIYVLSNSMREKVNKYSNSSRVVVIHNWSAFSGFKPIPKEANQFRKRSESGRKFVVQYSGNIGATHNVEAMVEVASLFIDYNDVEFQIIGRGERVNVIGEMIESKGLINCHLLSFRDDSELFESLCSADLAVVTLDTRTKDVSVPSKVYNIMAAGLPIMAISHDDSALCQLVKGNNAGMVFNDNDICSMKDFILKLKTNDSYYKEISQNSLYASRNYTNTNAAIYLKTYIME